jgi:hypothetical protein
MTPTFARLGVSNEPGAAQQRNPLFVCVDQEGIVHCLGYSTSAILCCDGKLDDGEGATRLLRTIESGSGVVAPCHHFVSAVS